MGAYDIAAAPWHRAGHALMNQHRLTADEASGVMLAAADMPGRPVRGRTAEVIMDGTADSPTYAVRDMAEEDAVRVLLGGLAGPSARWDAEATLAARGWSSLAICLAKIGGPAAFTALGPFPPPPGRISLRDSMILRRGDGYVIASYDSGRAAAMFDARTEARL